MSWDENSWVCSQRFHCSKPVYFSMKEFCFEYVTKWRRYEWSGKFATKVLRFGGNLQWIYSQLKKGENQCFLRFWIWCQKCLGENQKTRVTNAKMYGALDIRNYYHWWSDKEITTRRAAPILINSNPKNTVSKQSCIQLIFVKHDCCCEMILLSSKLFQEHYALLIETLFP